MSLHTDLDIFRTATDLLGVVVDLLPHFPRVTADVRRELLRECTAVLVAVPMANAEMGKAKVPYIQQLLRHLYAVQFLLRVAVDKRFISREQFARTLRLTTSISKQAHGWKKRFAASSPVS